MFKKLLSIFFIIVLGSWAIRPFFVPGFFPIHDDTQVERVFEMHKALSDGAFPVRWVADLGYHYGYPIFNFYAPLAYYVGALFMFVGFTALVATKIMMALGIVFAGIFMYFFAKELWGRMGGIISAVLYIYVPYHAVNIYVRGDVAEFWAYSFIPLAFLGVYKIYLLLKENSKLKIQKLIWPILIGSVGYAGIILSHNLTAMMVSPFLFLFALILGFLVREKINFLKLVSPLFLGIILAAFYWLPVFAEMQYTNVLSQVGGGSDYKDHFVCPMQLWNSPWGFGGSIPGCIDGMSFMLGKLHIVVFFLSLIGLWVLRKQDKKKFVISLFFVGGTFLTIFLLLSVSKFIWDGIRPMAFFQFPWRFLLIETFFLSLVSGAIVLLFKNLPDIVKKSLGVGIIFCIIFFNADLFIPQMYLDKVSSDYTNPYNLWWRTSKISDEYMPQNFKKPKSYDQVPRQKITEDQNVKIVSLSEKTQSITAKIDVKERTALLIHHAYFPGWKIFIDNKQVNFTISDRGFIVKVPEGLHSLRIVFNQTSLQQIANTISLTGVILLIIGIIKKRNFSPNDKKTT